MVEGRARRWGVRYKSPTTGRRREMGIGSARDITLAEAREAAAAARRLVRDGVDPIEKRRQGRTAEAQQRARTFAEVAAAYIDDRRSGWRDGRSESVWTSSLARLAFPAIGELPVEAVTTKHVIRVLRPIWTTTTESADRLRGRIESILNYATTHGWREGENPARWRGHLENILPKPSSVTVPRHHAAVEWRNMAQVMAALGRSSGVGAMAVRFTCLSAARSGEVRGAVWAEIDLAAKVWTVPATRMKGGKEHRVPLSDGAMAILLELQPLRISACDLVFPGGRPGRPLSDVALSKALHLAAGTKAVTVHGLRSAFRDWTAEATEFPREVAEMALAHAIGNRVEAAYRRGDLFEKRRQMMDAWSKFSAA